MRGAGSGPQYLDWQPSRLERLDRRTPVRVRQKPAVKQDLDVLAAVVDLGQQLVITMRAAQDSAAG